MAQERTQIETYRRRVHDERTSTLSKTQLHLLERYREYFDFFSVITVHLCFLFLKMENNLDVTKH